VTSARNLVRAAVAVMRVKNAKTIALIYDSVSPFAADACRAQRQSLTEQGLTVLGMYVAARTGPESEPVWIGITPARSNVLANLHFLDFGTLSNV
jgi:hypothetical protein